MPDKTKIRLLREEQGFTQLNLAEKTGLSLSTIQRVESGQTIPKGHTLKVLSETLGIAKSALKERTSVSEEDLLNIRMINLASLAFIIIPFGNIWIPLLIWNKKRTSTLVDKLGRRIINFQIIWSAITIVFLLGSPFIQKSLLLSFPLLLLGLACSGIFNLIMIVKTAIAIQKEQLDFLKFKLQFL